MDKITRKFHEVTNDYLIRMNLLCNTCMKDETCKRLLTYGASNKTQMVFIFTTTAIYSKH